MILEATPKPKPQPPGGELVAEKVLMPQQRCPFCPGEFIVLQIKGAPGPQVMHRNPVCATYDLGPQAYLKKVAQQKSTQGDVPKAPVVNRKARRRQLRAKRRK